MAKKKRSRARKRPTAKRKVSRKKKSHTMPRKKRRRRSRSVARLSSAPKRRRRKRGLSAMGGTGLMMSVKKNGLGALGGGLVALSNLAPMKGWMKSGIALVLSVPVSMYGSPFVGAGMAGAATAQLAGQMFPALALNDGDMQDVEYVNPNTLSDTGYMDDEGCPIVQDLNDGSIYALQDNGDLNDLNDAYALHDGSNLPGVSMLPLMYDQPKFGLQSQYGIAV